MTNKQWIVDKIAENYSNKELIDMYESFKDDTGSICSLKTYKNLIYKYRSKPFITLKSTESLTKEEKGNEVIVISRSEDIKTLDQLIKAAEIDLDIWKVTSFKVNKWSTPMKIKDVVTQVDNWQVKASLSKKILSPTDFEPLVPIEINTIPLDLKVKEFSNFKTALILSDAQIGFKRDLYSDKLIPMHDRDSLSIALQVAVDDQPEEIIFNGDFLDLSDWSDKFVQSSEFAFLLQKSVIELGWWIGQFHNAVSNAKISFILGNHEERLDRAIIRNLPLAYGLKSIDNLQGESLLSIQNMIRFDDFEINWSKQYPYGEIWLNSKTRVSHGKVIGAGSGATTQKVNKLSNNNEIFGHIHRVEQAIKTVYTHEGSYDVGAYSFGCLCKTDGSVPSSTPNLNWQQGFGLVKYNENEEYIESIHIRDHKIFHNGLEYSSYPNIEETIFKEIGV